MIPMTTEKDASEIKRGGALILLKISPSIMKKKKNPNPGSTNENVMTTPMSVERRFTRSAIFIAFHQER